MVWVVQLTSYRTHALLDSMVIGSLVIVIENESRSVKLVGITGRSRAVGKLEVTVLYSGPDEYKTI